MEKKNKKINIYQILQIVLIVLVLAFIAMCIIVQLIDPSLNISKWIIENVWDLNKTKAIFNDRVPTIIRSLIYIVLIYGICKLIRLIFRVQMKKNHRSKTIFTLLDGFTKYACAVIIILLILSAFGVDTTALVASVGVLTLIVGLGAQSLIADIIAGIFIIFENEYNVGEIISVDGFRGTVVEIGIRSTKVIDAAGNIKIINNSNIGDIVNLSRELSLAVVDLDFPYDVPVDLVENILKDNFKLMQKNINGIVDGPFYKGICNYKDSNVTLKIVAQCKEEDRFQVERDLMREYRRILLENNIDMSYHQVVINYAETKEYSSNSKSKKEAEAFVKKQKILSKDLEEQENQ
ncbi:MAG: mechanosensitive ion channel family protein [Bacilli bacterium]|nr:mechanosensitive ion channel family protein [Bacilli bacterium]